MGAPNAQHRPSQAAPTDWLCQWERGTKAIFEEGYRELLHELHPAGAWDIVSAQDFVLMDNVWEYAPDHEFGSVPPAEYITDRTIAVGREHDRNHIAHYI